MSKQYRQFDNEEFCELNYNQAKRKVQLKSIYSKKHRSASLCLSVNCCGQSSATVVTSNNGVDLDGISHTCVHCGTTLEYELVKSNPSKLNLI